jgi:hypothetical protein
LVNSLLWTRVWGINQKGSIFASEWFTNNGGFMECIIVQKLEWDQRNLLDGGRGIMQLVTSGCKVAQ